MGLGVALTLSSCSGYGLRGTDRPFFERENIKSLYVAPVRNDSFRPGVEIMMYNAVRKRYAAGGYVRIVDQKNLADATLQAVVTQAEGTPGGAIRADQLAQADVTARTAPRDLQIASNYNVSLGVNFALVNAKGRQLWGTGITRSKVFQASTYFGSLGNTSALINDSMFESTLSELAVRVVTDAEESMNAFF